MLVTGQEVVVDLTDETSGDAACTLLRRAKEALDQTVMELTIVYHLDTPFLVTNLVEMLLLVPNLESLSMFSLAFNGTTPDFEALSRALKGHKKLKEVHMIDCGMYGTWSSPVSLANSVANSMTNSIHSNGTNGTAGKLAASKIATIKEDTSHEGSLDEKLPAKELPTAKKMPSIMGPPTKRLKANNGDAAAGTSSATAATASISNSVSTTQTGASKIDQSVVSKKVDSSMMSICSSAPRTMDVILEALGSIQSLENVELYGIPSLLFSLNEDDTNESSHAPVGQEGEGSRDIPMVPMGMDDSVTYSDDDYMDDYDEDIRGIPGNKRAANSPDKNLSLLMSPKSIGALCRGPKLTNLGLEDLNLKDDHIILMMQSLSRKGSALKELKIWGCNIRDKACLAIAQMLQVNTTLERLDLANNHIDDEGCILIANALHGNTSLISLNLMGNECAQNYDAVSVGGAYEALLNLLQKNKTLTDLVLEPYEQDDEADVPEFIFITKHADVPSSASDSDADSVLSIPKVDPLLSSEQLADVATTLAKAKADLLLPIEQPPAVDSAMGEESKEDPVPTKQPTTVVECKKE